MDTPISEVYNKIRKIKALYHPQTYPIMENGVLGNTRRPERSDQILRKAAAAQCKN